MLKAILKIVNAVGQTVYPGDINRLEIYEEKDENTVIYKDTYTNSDEDILRNTASRIGAIIEDKTYLKGKKIIRKK